MFTQKQTTKKKIQTLLYKNQPTPPQTTTTPKKKTTTPPKYLGKYLKSLTISTTHWEIKHENRNKKRRHKKTLKKIRPLQKLRYKTQLKKNLPGQNPHHTI